MYWLKRFLERKWSNCFWSSFHFPWCSV